jgi:uncharacterized protein
MDKNKITGPVSFHGVYIEELSSANTALEGIPTSITAFVGYTKRGVINAPVTVTRYLEYEQAFGGLSNESRMGFAVRDFFTNGGQKAIIVRVEDTREADKQNSQIIGSEQQKTGLYALDKADLFSILCIPPLGENKDIGMDVISVASNYCEKRRAMLIVDSPKTWLTADDAKKGLSDIQANHNIVKKNVTIYFPGIRRPNPLRHNAIETFAPCGAIAGVMSRIDLALGIWRPPAGTNALINGIAGISIDLSDTDIGDLARLGCNCLRTFPGAGHVIWGARTLAGYNDLFAEWKYIPVRRFALYLEESLSRGLKWVVFEPNTEVLWAQIRLKVQAFMEGLWRAGAFQGPRPQDAFFVKCGRETTTLDDIANGRVNVFVGFAPLKPAEFVTIKISLITGAAN